MDFLLTMIPTHEMYGLVAALLPSAIEEEKCYISLPIRWCINQVLINTRETKLSRNATRPADMPFAWRATLDLTDLPAGWHAVTTIFWWEKCAPRKGKQYRGTAAWFNRSDAFSGVSSPHITHRTLIQ